MSEWALIGVGVLAAWAAAATAAAVYFRRMAADAIVELERAATGWQRALEGWRRMIDEIKAARDHNRDAARILGSSPGTRGQA